MAQPNGGLITETNQQYYAGAQGFVSTNQNTFTFTFDTQLVFGSWDPADVDYALNNFKLYLVLGEKYYAKHRKKMANLQLKLLRRKKLYNFKNKSQNKFCLKNNILKLYLFS